MWVLGNIEVRRSAPAVWDGIHILACVPLFDIYGHRKAQDIVASFVHYEDKPKSISINMELIGSDLTKLQGCLSQFCMVLDKMFRFHDIIKAALMNAIKRMVNFARTKIGLHDDRTVNMFKYCANEFQRAIGEVYRVATGAPTPDKADLVARLNIIPECGSDSQFLWEVQLIMLGAKEPRSAGTASTVPKIKAKGAKVLRNTAVVSPPPAAGSTPVAAVGAKTICGYWNSVAGCTRSANECSFAHRKAVSLTDSASLDAFFAATRNKNKVRKV